MKTGYCHIYNRKAPLDSITDRLHIGNRWLGLSDRRCAQKFLRLILKTKLGQSNLCH